MADVIRPIKRGDVRTFDESYSKGFKNIWASEVDDELDILYDAWNFGTINIGPGAVGPDQIQDGAIVAGKLGPDSVATVNIQDYAVTRDEIAPESITNDKIYPGSVTGTSLASNSVEGTHIVDGTVSETELSTTVKGRLVPIYGPADANKTLITNGAGSALIWAAGAPSAPSGLAGGDLTGSYPNPTVWNAAANFQVVGTFLAIGQTTLRNGPVIRPVTATTPSVAFDSQGAIGGLTPPVNTIIGQILSYVGAPLGGQMTFFATENWVPGTSTGVGLSLNLCQPGSTLLRERMRFGQSGWAINGIDGTQHLSLDSVGVLAVTGGRTNKARVTQHTNDLTYLTNNISVAPITVVDDNAQPSWAVVMGGGVATDSFRVRRASAGSLILVDLMTLSNTGNLLVTGSGSNPVTQTIQSYVNSATGTNLSLQTARGTLAAPTPLLANDALAQVSAAGQYSTTVGQQSIQAMVRAVAAENWTASARGCYWNFYMTPLGSTVQSSTVVFDKDGNILISGSVGQKASGTAWSNPSDPRLKRDMTPYTTGLEAIIQLQPITFKWNGKGETIDDGNQVWGFDASEVQGVMPECVGTKEVKLGKEDEVETEILTMDVSNILLALVNAVKELAARVVALEAV